ncbi:CotH kinase family protein [Nanoarchaeota archaeon]
MKIKNESKKKGFSSLSLKRILNKKNLIIVSAFFLIGFFVVGVLFGIFITGFFGTFDNPSSNAIKLINFFGFSPSMGSLQLFMRDVISENIFIPVNFIKGAFSNPEKMYIDISFKNYEKLLHKREQSLKLGILFSSEEDYVPAKIRFNDQIVDVKLRLKGDALDHIKGERWSFRIKVKGDETLFGMEVLSIQDPKTRNFLNEFIFQEALRREGVISLRTKFIEVFINGESRGIYELEEHFDKRLIENNNLREGPIIKFNEGLFYDRKVFGPTIEQKTNAKDSYFNTDIDSFQTKRIMNDSIKYEQYLKAKNLLESFRQGKLNSSEVFDLEKQTRFFAISELMDAHHGLHSNNVRYYYNPVTSKLEPIGFDGDAGEWNQDKIFLTDKYTPFVQRFFKDNIFFETYIKELRRVSQKSYLDKLFSEIDEELEDNLNIIHKEYQSYHFSKEDYYKNQEDIRKYLEPIQPLQAYFYKKTSNSSLIIQIANTQEIPIKIRDLIYKGIILRTKKDIIMNSKKIGDPLKFRYVEFFFPENFEWSEDIIRNIELSYQIIGIDELKKTNVYPWARLDENFIENDFIRKKPNINEFDFLAIDESKKIIHIKKGSWIIDRNLIIPQGFIVSSNKGTVMDLKNNSIILSYSRFNISGTKEEPIKIESSDGTGQGIALLNTDENSILKYVIFDNLAAPSFNGWELTGAVTFYESPVYLESCHFINIRSEDALNIIRSSFAMKNSFFNNTLSDCFDGDFVSGSIVKSSFFECGNDAVDLSGSEIKIDGIKIIDAGDKGLSFGEKSKLQAEDVFIKNSYIGVASKDQSQVKIKNLNISNSEYGIASYEKKSEFGPASINITGVLELNDIKTGFILEKGSEIEVNGIGIKDFQTEVYKKLYPNE